MYCTNCGVELEDTMSLCPLCGQPVNKSEQSPSAIKKEESSFRPERKDLTPPQKKHIWEITSITLLAAASATLIIDMIISGKVTWSAYPLAVCIIAFSYITLLAFLKRGFLFHITGGFVISSGLLGILDAVTNGVGWSVRIVIPMLFSVNLVVIALRSVIRSLKYRGINMIAYSCLAAGIVCICVEAILSQYKTGSIKLQWSLVVLLSIIPVALVLLYLHFRFKKGRNLNRTFHM